MKSSAKSSLEGCEEECARGAALEGWDLFWAAAIMGMVERDMPGSPLDTQGSIRDHEGFGQDRNRLNGAIDMQILIK